MRGIGYQPDVLAAVTASQRRERERADAQYIGANLDGGMMMMADREALLKFGNTFAGVTGVDWKLKPYNGTAVDVVICARVDLDHPIYFNDNLLTDCTDCGCRLQVRPDAPKGERLCVCCTARRLRASRL